MFSFAKRVLETGSSKTVKMRANKFNIFFKHLSECRRTVNFVVKFDCRYFV